MNLEELKSFLDQEDVAYKDVGNRILLAECFECGYTKYKTSFRNPEKEGKVLWGKCFRCESSFSSYSYLLEMGFSKEAVKKLHNFKAATTSDRSEDFMSLLDEEERRREATNPKETYVPKGVSIADFFPIGSWADHPASKYAVKRGVPEDLYRHVMMDPISNSVVFLCWEKDRIVGWQKRFVRPPRPNFKTQNPPADQFKKSMHVIEYENDGPVVVCEGPFTGIAAWRLGYHAIVTFGSAVSKTQLERIHEVVKRTGKPLYVSFDLDAAGFKGFFKIKNYFERRDIEAKRIQPEEGNDLNDSWQAGKAAKVIEDDPYDSTVPVLDIFGDIYRG